MSVVLMVLVCLKKISKDIIGIVFVYSYYREDIL